MNARTTFIIACAAMIACDSPFFDVYDGGIAADAGGDAGTTPACATFALSTFELGVEGRVFVALSLDDGSALIGVRDPETVWFTVTTSGPTRLAAATPGLNPL